jgi:hypothetical protein
MCREKSGNPGGRTYVRNTLGYKKGIKKLTADEICFKNTWKPFSGTKCSGTYKVVVIASASRREGPGFESRQGVRFFGLSTLQWSCLNLISIVCVY